MYFASRRLDGRDLLLVGPPLVAGGGEPRLDAGDRVARALQPRVERLRAVRMVGDPPSGVVGGGFELLQPDEAVRSGFI